MIFKHNPDGSIQIASQTRVDLSQMSEDTPSDVDQLSKVYEKTRDAVKAAHFMNKMRKRVEKEKQEEKRKFLAQKLAHQLQVLKEVIKQSIYKGDEALYETTMKAREKVL